MEKKANLAIQILGGGSLLYVTLKFSIWIKSFEKSVLI